MFNEIQSNKNTNESHAPSKHIIMDFFTLLLLLLLLFIQAVDTMDLDVLFPGPHSGLPEALIDQRILKELERSTLNDEQKKALRSMVDPRYTGVRIK